MKMNLIITKQLVGPVLYADILQISNDIPSLQTVKTWSGKSFLIKHLGEATYILDDNVGGIKSSNFKSQVPCLYLLLSSLSSTINSIMKHVTITTDFWVDFLNYP